MLRIRRYITNRPLDEIFEIEFNKSIKKLKKATPKGQIRFMLVDFEKMLNNLKKKIKNDNLEELFNAYLVKNNGCSGIIYTTDFFGFIPYQKEAKLMSLSNTYGSNPRFRFLLVFYANNIVINPNYLEDFITYWFEKFILPNFKQINNKGNRKIHYFYFPISLALFNYTNIDMDDYVKKLILKLCKKHNLKLDTSLLDLKCAFTIIT